MGFSDYVIERSALIRISVPCPLFQAQGKTPYECNFGTQNDMSSMFNFGWHEWVHYRDHSTCPENKEKLGRIIGPCKNKGNEKAQCIVASSSYAITRRTVRSLRTSKLRYGTDKRKRIMFNEIILQKLVDSVAKSYETAYS